VLRFNSITLSFFIFLIFLITILIIIFIFLILLLILLLIYFLYIYYCIIFCLNFLFSGSLSSSFFFILLINIRIHAFYKNFYLKMPKLKFKALIYFNNISFCYGSKDTSGISNKTVKTRP
jgi:hypothetical protein